MLNDIKRFIKKNLFSDSHPLLMSMYHSRQVRQLLAWQECRASMTYAEIEAEISRGYEEIFGRTIDWDNPKTYNEKIHVSKVYMVTSEKTRLADKYLVREWICSKIGAQYLVPLLGVYDKFSDIDFDSLPEQFVIKCNHDWNSVTLVEDKSKIDIKPLERKYDLFMKRNFAYRGFEMQYRDIKPKIMIEEYMGGAVNDYKFMCFDNEVYYCWVDFDRFGNHKRNFYDLNWQLQPFNQYHYGNYDKPVPCPECYEEMKHIASVLCKGFEHVRVDLYVIDNRVYFGEMTFSNGDGFEEITPEEYSYKLGDLWPFDNTIRRKILSEKTKP